jgi:putative aldouronate transport system substrate-binding protein
MRKGVSVLASLMLIIFAVLSGCRSSSSGGEAKAVQTDDGGKYDHIGWDSSELSWKKDTSPVSFSTYIDFDWYQVDTWGKDDVSKEITKRTGVSLEVTKSSDLKQLQVLLAADELPDLIFTSNQVERFYNSDLVWPWDELIKKYAPEFMHLIDPVEIVNNSADDGHFYTLKTHYNNQTAWEDPRNLPSPGDPGLYVREDILKELGNPPLDSFEDVLNIFKMVKEKHPDMVVYLPHPTWTNAFADFLGLRSTVPYADAKGNVHYGIMHPDFLKYYKFMNTLYREGYLSSESFAYKPEQFFQIVRSGKVFAASYNSGLADETNKIFDETGIKGHFVPVIKALTYEGQDKMKIVDASVGWASLFISKKVKDPARAIRYAEFLKSPEGDQLTQWGIEGKHYTLKDGLLQRNPEVLNRLVTELGIGPWYFQASGLGEGVAVSSSALSSPYHSGVDLLKFRKTRYVRDPALSFTKPQADTDEFNIDVKLTDLITNSEIGIITAPSEAEAEAKYNKMIDDAKKIGVEKLEEYMTDRYQKAKAKYAAIQK